MSSNPDETSRPVVSANATHRLRRLRSRRSPGLQRASLRTFIDKIETFELEFDPDDVGESQQWFVPFQHKFSQTVQIGPIELLPTYPKTPNTADNPAIARTVVWYHKTLYIPRRADKHYKINFARAFYITKVWANGQLLADVDGQSVHLSGFSSFSYDLTDAIDADNKVELIVRVENNSDPTICRGKQWSSQHPRKGIWYGQASGLWGQVTLEEVNGNRLRSDVTGYADPQTGLVRLEVITSIVDEATYSLEASVADPSGSTVVHYRRNLKLTPGQWPQEMAFVVPDPQPWSPSQPTLYKADVSLRRADGDLLDRLFFNIGFRSLTVAPAISPLLPDRAVEPNTAAPGLPISTPTLRLNGQPIYLNGVLYQPYHGDSYTLSYEQLKADLHYTRQTTGANLLRIHIAGADPLPLYVADELGLLVWVEVPSPHISNPTSRANHRRELESLLRQIDAHPCVCIVSIYNESWGCQDVSENSPAGEATRAYIKEAYHFIKQRRPDLLVVDNDGWEHLVEDDQLVATDLATLHLYVNQLSQWQSDLKNLPGLFEPQNPRYEQLTGHLAVVSSGKDYVYRADKPIVISEWGGFGALYGGPAAQLEKFKLIRHYKEAMHEPTVGLSGDCYTQLGDVEEETNGLLDKERARLSDNEFVNISGGLLA